MSRPVSFGYKMAWLAVRSDSLEDVSEGLAIEGADGFYRGDIAQKLVSSVQANGGVWSLQDLIQYQVVERDPVRFRFASADFVTASLPSSGGVVLASIFNMLDALNYQQAEETRKRHILVEAMRRAYRDRAVYLGDLDYIDIPLPKVTSPASAV